MKVEMGTHSGAFPAQASGAERPAASEFVADHLLTHFPKDSCCAEYVKAKEQNTPRRSTKHTVEPSPDDGASAEQFGDLLTADHFVISGEAAAARGESMYGLVMQDKTTMWVDCFPGVTKSTGDCCHP